MFGKSRFIFLVISVFLICGCAQPKYELATEATLSNNPAGQSQKTKATECAIKFKNSGYCLFWDWEALPKSNQSGSLIFKIYRSNLYDDSLVYTDFDFIPSLLLWMPSMGHGSSPTKVSRLDVGTYRASDVFFIMPGKWDMQFQIKDGSRLVDEAIVHINF